MRLAFWRGNRDSAPVRESFLKLEKSSPAAREPGLAAGMVEPRGARAAAAMPRPAAALADSGDLDLRAIWQSLLRKRHWVIGPTLLALVISLALVNMITPRYKSEARILIDGRENVFLRPNGERIEERTALDPEAVTSQVQLLLSRDLAREVIKTNKLGERPEFDPVLHGISPLKTLLALFGVGRDPFRLTPEERVLDAYFERLTAYAVDKSRVVVIEFQSRDPDLAARVANSIADGYLAMQQGARQNQARSAGVWLSGEIDSLRKKVAEAEGRVEEFRSKSSLFIGTNNTSLSNQQLGELNTQLGSAKALKSDAETKSRLIREMLNTGKPIEASEVLNSELTRRLSEQRVTLRAQLAEQSSTLLDGHPRIKELKAQLGDLDRQLREEASKISRSLENDARIAGGRVEGLSNSLEQLKRQASSTNGQDVQLRALDREAKAQRDLLESYLAKYREATARENIDAAPSDGRIISRGIVTNTPAYPKKLPVVLIATLATLILTAGIIATGELLRMTSPRPFATPAAPVAAAAVVTPAEPTFAAIPAESKPVPEAIRSLANATLAAGAAAKKITVLGTGGEVGISLTALALARQLALSAKVVLVDLSTSSDVMAKALTEPSTPGLADLMLGEASFGQIISRDRTSPLHLVSAGRPGADRALLQSPRLTMALDALLRVYDHVLLDAGTGLELPATILTSAQARAVLVPDQAMAAHDRIALCQQLKAVGFADVVILDCVAAPVAAVFGQRTAAA